jgi:SAM-dependent methyltransferase
MSLAHTVGTLSLLGDESRLRLCALLGERELSVSDLVRVTGISQSRVSTHLARLREGGFVRDRRDGQHAFYALSCDALPANAKAIIDGLLESPDATLEGDRKRLAALDRERRGGLPENFVGEMERHYSPGRTWHSLAVGLAALLDLGDVLDVGSGDGAVASYLAPYSKTITCVDTRADMVAAARSRLARFPHAQALEASAAALPFGAASFDQVVVFHTLTYAENAADAVRECARVLRPGGRLVVLSLDEHEQREVTAHYGERHPGFSPRAVKSLLSRADLEVRFCETACREAKKPHFQVVLAIAQKPRATAHKKVRKN